MKMRSFQDLCSEYRKLIIFSERLNNNLAQVSQYLSCLVCKVEKLTNPEVEIFELRSAKESDLTGSVRRYLIVRKARVVDLKSRKFFVYRLQKWISYDDESDFSELDFIPLTAGEVVEERGLDLEFVSTVKSLQRKIKKLTKQKKFLRKRLSEVNKRIDRILIEVARDIFGGDSFDECEIDIAKSYIEEALSKQIFDLQVLIGSKKSVSNAKEKLLDLIFGVKKGEEKKEEEKEEMKVYVKDFDMSYVMTPSDRGGWIIRDGKVFMLIDRSFVPQPGICFYRGRVKKVIIDKRGQQVPIIEIIGKF